MTQPKEKPRFCVGDRVRIYAFSSPIAKYLGTVGNVMTGTILRLFPEGARVSIDGSASQDSEGNDAYEDFFFEQLRKIKPRAPLRELYLYYDGNETWTGSDVHLGGKPLHVREVRASTSGRPARKGEK